MARTPEHKRVKTDAESRARGQAARRTQAAASRGGSASNATSLLGKRRADPEEPAGSGPAKRRAPTGSSGQVVDNQSTMTSLLGKRRADPDDAVDSHNTKRRAPASSSRKVLHNQPSIKDASTAAPTLLTSASTTQSRRPADTTSANIQVAVRVRGESWIDSPPAAECCLITEGARSDTLAVYTEPGAGILTAPPTSSLLPFASPIKPSRGKGAAAASDGVATSGKGKAKADSTDVSSRRTYNFDHVFGPEADQNMVYQDVAAPIISDVLDGYNCTIFCYGQTGTGKTHTMEGDLSPHPSSGTFASGAGIIPRTLFRIFHQLEQSGAEFSVRVTYVELYNEEARDLLADEDLNATTAADESDVSATKKTKPGAQVKAGKGGKSQASSSSSNNNNKAGIRILNDSKTGVKLEGVEEVPITSAEHGLNILRRGSAKRQVASTNCNSQSSRSHSIFTLTIHHTTTTNLSSSQSGPAPGGPSATRPPVLGADGQPVNTAASGQSGEDVFRIGKLNLVDLAGSENIGRSGAAERQAKEAGMINQSLLTLGRVINALVEKQSHIPYRESKLTRLLQESLGGRTKTCIIATVSELRSSMDETLSTLEYATRARSIQTRPELNARTTRTALLSEYIAENLRLREDLKVTRSRNGVYLSPEQMQKMDQDYANAVTEKDKIKAQYDLAKSENQSVQEQLEQNSAVLARKEEEARAAKAEVERLRKLNSNLQSDLDEAVERRKEAEEQRRSYQRNGQTLNHVAEGFKGLMKQGVEELDQLHNVIEKGVADAKVNCDLIDRMGTAIQESMTTIGAQTRTFKAAQDQFATDLVSMLQRTWTEQEKAGKVALTELLGEMDELRDKLLGIAHQQGEIRDDGARIAAELTSIKKAITQASKKRHHELKASIESILTGVSSQLQEFDRETTSSVVNATQIAEEMSKDVASLVDGAKDQLSTFQTQVIARIQEERRMLDVERTQLNEVRAQERMRAKAAHDAFVANLQQAAQHYTQASLESYERLAAETETSLANRDDMLKQTEQHQEAFVQPLQQQLAAMGDCGGGSMEQVLTSLQTVESNSAKLNSGVDQVFQDFRARTLEPSDRQVAADCKQMEAEITNTADFAVRTATSSAKALTELALEMQTDIETIRVYGKSSLSTATDAIKELTDSVSKQTRSQSNDCIQYAHDWDTRSRSLLAETTKLSAARTHAQGIPVRRKYLFPETWETIPQVSPTSQFPNYTFSVQGLPQPPAAGPSLSTPRATGGWDGEFLVPALPVTPRRRAGRKTGVGLTPSAF